MSRGCSQGWTLMKYLSPGNQREQQARWGMGTGRAERGLRALPGSHPLGHLGHVLLYSKAQCHYHHLASLPLTELAKSLVPQS